MKEFYQYEGEPTDKEIQQLKTFDKENCDHLAIRPTCPNCNSNNTMWRRQQWYICFDCASSFTLDEMLAARVFGENNYESVEDREFWRQFDEQV